MTDLDDDLHSFISDCEFKTRKILRDANKRRQVSPTILICYFVFLMSDLRTNDFDRTMLNYPQPKNG